MGRRKALLAPVERLCKDCQQVKPISEFYRKTARTFVGASQFHHRCKRCFVAHRVHHRSKTREEIRQRKAHWWRTRGRFTTRDFTLRRNATRQEAYDIQFAEQNERCAICLRVPLVDEFKFPFDHDHVTGLARGILCAECNNGLGCFKDRGDLLIAALRYLEHWRVFHREVQPEAVNE